MHSAGHHQDVMTHQKVGDHNIEKLARHVLKKPEHIQLINKRFPKQQFLQHAIHRPTPKNLLFYPPF